MGSLERISKEKIERARQMLLAEIYTEKSDDRHIKRDAVKQLLAPLIAARESGLSFEEISKIFNKAGLLLSPKTLERYYYALKTEDELTKEAQLHAKKVTKMRQAIEAKTLRAHQVHGTKVALDFIEVMNAQTRLYNALGSTKLLQPIENMPPEIAKDLEPTSEKRTRSANQSPVVSSSDKRRGETASTINEIERRSFETEERTQIIDDVELRQGRVYYASGKPFIGTLTKKQIHLLRTVGKIIAISSCESSKDFISMPSKI